MKVTLNMGNSTTTFVIVCYTGLMLATAAPPIDINHLVDVPSDTDCACTETTSYCCPAIRTSMLNNYGHNLFRIGSSISWKYSNLRGLKDSVPRHYICENTLCSFYNHGNENDNGNINGNGNDDIGRRSNDEGGNGGYSDGNDNTVDVVGNGDTDDDRGYDINGDTGSVETGFVESGDDDTVGYRASNTHTCCAVETKAIELLSVINTNDQTDVWETVMDDYNQRPTFITKTCLGYSPQCLNVTTAVCQTVQDVHSVMVYKYVADGSGGMELKVAFVPVTFNVSCECRTYTTPPCAG